LLADPLVVALSVEGEFAEDGTVLGDDLEVGTGDEQGDRLPASAIADMEMTESAEVADGDLAAAIELVAADSVLKP